jgi:hypothetical protein
MMEKRKKNGDFWDVTDVSEKLSASFIRVTREDAILPSPP